MGREWALGRGAEKAIPVGKWGEFFGWRPACRGSMYCSSENSLLCLRYSLCVKRWETRANNDRDRRRRLTRTFDDVYNTVCGLAHRIIQSGGNR